MTSQEPTLSQDNVLPQLKGAPLAVLLSLWQDGPDGRKALIERTGWQKDAVGAALKRLIRLKLVVRHSHRRWGVAAGVSVPHLLGLPGQESGERPQKRPSPEGRRASQAAATAGEARKMRSQAGSAWAGRRDKGQKTAFLRQAGARARDDHDLYDDLHSLDPHDMKKTDHEQADMALIQSLQALRPPFDHAWSWLRTVSPGLVARWLAHLEAMPPSQRALIRNEAAFIRSRVRAGLQPPRNGPGTAHRRPRQEATGAHGPRVERRSNCPRCGRAYFDSEGRCLVCTGVFKV